MNFLARCGLELYGWVLGLLVLVVYVLTLSVDVPFWDGGEFITTSMFLQVGHPPGAPLYELLTHLFSLLGSLCFGPVWWCNFFSALCTALTVVFMFRSLMLMLPRRHCSVVAATVGCLCFAFCHTVWESAVEAEVYAMAVMVCALELWVMLKWYYSADKSRVARLLALEALLIGMSLCVHLMCLLVVSALLFLFFSSNGAWLRTPKRLLWLMPLLFVVGLSLYAIVPIRSAANPPINIGKPCTVQRFSDYVGRKQYEHAPLYPRMWRHRGSCDEYAAYWSGNDTTFWGNARYAVSYQFFYMYGRYLLWNFSGRFNGLQGFGSLQKGQFITGFPCLDALVVGTGSTPPEELVGPSHTRYFLIPLLLGLLGLLFYSTRRRDLLWVTLLLFLFGGLFLSVYLNHPAYEPRERDYVYVLSFYAFCFYIAMGVQQLLEWLSRWRYAMRLVALLMLGVPLLTICQNWKEHDKSNDYVAYDSAVNLLRSCPQNAVLYTFGDNDTYPLWCVQQVEGVRRDVRVENINLIGHKSFFNSLLDTTISDKLFSHYAYNAMRGFVGGMAQLSGFAYRLAEDYGDSVDVDRAYPVMMDSVRWRVDDGVFCDDVASSFTAMYWKDVMMVVDNLLPADTLKAQRLLHKTLRDIPLEYCSDIALRAKIVKSLHDTGMTEDYDMERSKCLTTISTHLDYYGTFSRSTKPYVKTTVDKLLASREMLEAII